MGLLKIAFVLITVTAIVACAVYYTNSLMAKTLNEPFEKHDSNDAAAGADGDGKKKTRIVLFHAEWCGHCVTYIKSGVFMDTYRDKVMTDAQFENVEFVMYDADTHKAMLAKYNVRSFPTIVALDPSGKLIDTFAGDRTDPADLIRFAQSAIA